MKLRLLLKTLRWLAKRYTKFNLFSYYPGDCTKYYGNFDYLEYYSGKKYPTKCVSSYDGYKTYKDIKKEYKHNMIRSMYALIGWLRYKRYERSVEFERKILTKLLK